MANPEYQEELDRTDKLSVCLYRVGISLFSLASLVLAALSYEAIAIGSKGSPYELPAYWSLLIATALCAANIHIYDKKIRMVIAWSGWISILLASMLSPVWLTLGFSFITFSGIALKESFCFKVPGLKLVPVCLVIAVLCMMLSKLLVLSALLLVVGLVMGFLSVKKWQMPLHFDIGIKANYQI